MRQLTFTDAAKTLVGDNGRFVQIGAFDGRRGDHMRYFVDNCGWRGVCVEPIPDAMAELRKNYTGIDGMTFVEAAIWTEPGPKVMHYLPFEAHFKGGVPLSVLSCSSFWQELVKDCEGMRESITVNCMTLNQLFRHAKVEAFDVFQCDAEGADYEIVKQLDLDKWRPTIVQFESRQTTEEQVADCDRWFTEHGYGFRHGRCDYTAWRLDAQAAAEEAE